MLRTIDSNGSCLMSSQRSCPGISSRRALKTVSFVKPFHKFDGLVDFVRRECTIMCCASTRGRHTKGRRMTGKREEDGLWMQISRGKILSFPVDVSEACTCLIYILSSSFHPQPHQRDVNLGPVS